jgi:DNA (cytosine-5)-methyltransferase 1
MPSAYYNEIDPYAAEWLRNLIKAGVIAPGDVDERSIAYVHPDDIRGYTQCHFFAGIGVWSYALRLAGWPDDRPIWTGSCPCQPFSGAGKRKGFADDRHLWPVWFDLIRERRPDIILGEQVASPDGYAWFDDVQADMEGLDHACGAVVTPAAGYGAPEERHRIYWMANANDARSQGRRERGHSAAGRLDNPTSARCKRTLEITEGEARHETRLRMSGEAGGSGRLDHATRVRHGPNDVEPIAGRRECSARQADGAHVGGVGNAELLGCDAGQSGNRGTAKSERRKCRHVADRSGAHVYPSPVNGFWRAADWLFCRDGKWRPVEPGTFPLVDGASNRVGQLRAYGNAIVATQAAEFVSVVMDIIDA